MPLMCSARSGLQLKHCGQRSQQQAYATVLAADEPALLCPFIMAGVERPLETVLSISIRVLLMLRGEWRHTRRPYKWAWHRAEEQVQFSLAALVCV